jgi:hypothetical protein
MSEDLNKEAFEGLDTAFNTEYKEDKQNSLITASKNEVQELQDEIKDLELKKDEIKSNIRIEDEEYLKTEIKSLMWTSKSVLERLESDIKIGSEARMYEVFGGLVNSLTMLMKELRNLNESIIKIKLEQNSKKTLSELGQNDKIALSSNQLAEMILAASEKSEFNKIEADFEIDDSDDLENRKKK